MRQGSTENRMSQQGDSRRSNLLRVLRFTPALAVALGCLGLSGAAQARPEYPGILSDAGASCVVTCLTCHTDPLGGATKLRVTPAGPWGLLFGAAVKNWTPTASAALDAYAQPDHDADMDGVPDLTEVRAGTDPLLKGPSSICTPAYGCGGGRIAHAPPSENRATTPALLLAAAALVFAGRRRLKPRAP